MQINTIRQWVAVGTIAAAMLAGLSVRAQAQEEVARKIKSQANPVYPDLARKMHIAGTVKIQVTVAKDGSVKSTKVVGGPPLLIDASVDAAKRFKFEEGKDDTTQVIEFKYNAQ